jgi:hypothetical protein
VGASGFKHPGFDRISDDKRIVIAKFLIPVTARATLAILVYESGDYVKCGPGCSGALKSKAQQVHSGQACSSVRQPCKYRFVPYGDTVLVRAHFSAPHPEGAADDHFASLARLRHVDVSDSELEVGIEAFTGQVLNYLGFARLAVAIFCEPDGAVGGGGRDCNERIAHMS